MIKKTFLIDEIFFTHHTNQIYRDKLIDEYHTIIINKNNRKYILVGWFKTEEMATLFKLKYGLVESLETYD